MLVNWFYATPDWILIPVFTLLFVGVSLAIVLVTRPLVQQLVHDSEQWDRVLGYTSGAFGVFFGILLALVAVSVYGNYTDAHAASLVETSKVGALSRGATGLPDELRDDVRAAIRDYVQTVITVEWPQQSAGELPTAGRADITKIEDLLYSFDPETFRDSASFSQLLATFDDLIEARRARIDATTLQLPGQFWLVIWVGAAINAILIGAVVVDDRRLHLALAGLLAVFVALVILVTADMDHPYAGSISVGPIDFEEILNIVDNPAPTS